MTDDPQSTSIAQDTPLTHLKAARNQHSFMIGEMQGMVNDMINHLEDLDAYIAKLEAADD